MLVSFVGVPIACCWTEVDTCSAREGRVDKRSLDIPSRTCNNQCSVHVHNKGARQKKIQDYLGVFPNRGWGGSPQSQNFCDLTK